MKKFLSIIFFTIFLTFTPVFAAENMTKILTNSQYTQQQKIEKISKRADELLTDEHRKEKSSLKNTLLSKIKKQDKKQILDELNFTDENNLSPLKLCILNGDFNTTQKILDLYKIYNPTQNIDSSELMFALDCASKHPTEFPTNIINLLISNGADCDFYVTERINSINYKKTVLHMACATENPEIINTILNRTTKNLDSNLPELNKNGIVDTKNALILLCQLQIKYFQANSEQNFYACIENLLQKKQSIINSEFFQNGYKGTALHEAARYNEKTLYDLLKKYGANNQALDNKNKSPVMYLQTFCENDTDALDLLCQEFPSQAKNELKENLIQKIMQQDINQLSSVTKKTPLIISILHDDKITAQKLIKAGANYYLTDNLGKNAIHYAIETNEISNLTLFMESNAFLTSEYLEYAVENQKNFVVQFFLDNNIYSSDAIILALENFSKPSAVNHQILNSLLKYKNYKLEDYRLKDNTTLLMHFAKYGASDFLKQVLPDMLLQDKKILEYKDSKGWTPFMYAAAYNTDTKIMKILRMYGANPFETDLENKNAADLAKTNNPNSKQVLECLESYGVY